MKNKIILIGLTLIFTICLNNIIIAQITRGAQPYELYISTEWYMDNYGQIHYAILHSTDNGENITLKYENVENTPPDEMSVGHVLGDASTGTLYNYGNNELWVSFDSGLNWEYREDYPGYTKFFSGVNQGLIFKGNSNGFFKSNDYAQTFELLPITVTCPFTEVGFIEPEFYGIYGESGIYFNFVHTIDYGQTYLEIPIDSNVAFWSPQGQYPQLSRGTESGELYLTSWNIEMHYKIFHSVDTGYTWTEKYESGYINVYFWRVQYTAGREPGSYYVIRSRINPAGDHVWLYFDYSNDYGETFTTYFHDLDSTITSIGSNKTDNITLSNYPNPLMANTTFRFRLPEGCKNPMLNIYNAYGVLIRQLNISGKNTQTWDKTDKTGNQVKEGLYLYNISYGHKNSQFHKLLITN
jgi:hypothetical protein